MLQIPDGEAGSAGGDHRDEDDHPAGHAASDRGRGGPRVVGDRLSGGGGVARLERAGGRHHLFSLLQSRIPCGAYPGRQGDLFAPKTWRSSFSPGNLPLRHRIEDHFPVLAQKLSQGALSRDFIHHRINYARLNTGSVPVT